MAKRSPARSSKRRKGPKPKKSARPTKRKARPKAAAGQAKGRGGKASAGDGRRLRKQDLAVALRVSVSRIGKYTQEGMPHTAQGPGKAHLYSLAECLDWLKEKGRGPLATEPDVEAEDGETRAEAELRLTKAKADKEELNLRVLRGELHDTAECRQHRIEQIHLLKRQFMALPRSAAPELEGHDREEIQKLLKVHVLRILERFAGGYIE